MAQVPKKLRPGYTFHHPVTGIALQRSLPEGSNSETEVFAINKDGGREKCPGPFFMLDEDAVKGQETKFEDPTPEEVKQLKKANSKQLDIQIAPPQNPMKTISIDDKAMKVTPSDKEVKSKPPAPPESGSDAMSLKNNSALGDAEKKKGKGKGK